MQTNGWAAEDMAYGVYRTPVGEALVLTLLDGTMDLDPVKLHGITAEAATALVEAAPNPPDPVRIRVAVNAYAIQHAGRTALIDAGGGSVMGPGVGLLPASLHAAGIHPASIDTVLMTHLHSDHAYGLVDAVGEPLFPNAVLRVAEAEARFWLAPGAEAASPQIMRSLAPYRARMGLFDGGEVFPGVTAVPLPGHTPGHTGFRIGDGPDAVLVWGDIVHVPEIQALHPEVAVAFDVDPAQAIETRRRLLDMAATDRLLVAGMHTRLPGTARVLRRGDAYELVAEPL